VFVRKVCISVGLVGLVVVCCIFSGGFFKPFGGGQSANSFASDSVHLPIDRPLLNWTDMDSEVFAMMEQKTRFITDRANEIVLEKLGGGFFSVHLQLMPGGEKFHSLERVMSGYAAFLEANPAFYG